MKILETTLPENFSKGLYEEKCYDLAAEHTPKIFYTLFAGAGELLNGAKTQSRPVALVFEDMKQNLIAAAIVQYIGNEQDETDPGKWSYVWTFSNDDIPSDALKISIQDSQTHPYFRAIAGDKWGMKFKDTDSLVILMTYALEQLRKWLDENCTENGETKIEQDDVFQARVGLEDGVKVFALEPMGETKALIKSDKDIQK